MKYTIDRLEEGLAMCEDEQKKRISIPVDRLPCNVREGDVLKEEDGLFSIDREETERRRKELKKKLTDLFE